MRKAWQRQEARLANLTGGSVNAGSGNGWSRKADVRAVWHLIEAKWTAKKSFTLKLRDLQAVAHHAALENRTPAFCIEFDEEVAPGRHMARRYVVLREEDYFSDDPRIS